MFIDAKELKNIYFQKRNVVVDDYKEIYEIESRMTKIKY